MRSILEAGNLKDKKVLLRVDFDVPVNEHGKITEAFRIEKQKETLEYLVAQGAKVVLVGHISAVPTFSDLIPQLHILLEEEIDFIKDISEIELHLHDYIGPALLENIRKWEGEEKDDESFARELASHFDIYVNNAFAVSHRNHASVSAITKFLPAYAGSQLIAEVENLKKVINAPKEGKLIIMGGAKASTKIPVIKNFLNKSEAILVGGVIANDILKFQGKDIGASRVDDGLDKLFAGIDLNQSHIILPEDFVTSENRHLDIGEVSRQKFIEKIRNAKTIIWNGPMGMFEDSRFAAGTKAIAEAVTNSSALTIIGGGDTIAAINQLGIQNNFSFVSTGGGAMLEFLAGNRLPGLDAIKYF
jgi:phosphoglycerate kinase